LSSRVPPDFVDLQPSGPADFSDILTAIRQGREWETVKQVLRAAFAFALLAASAAMSWAAEPDTGGLEVIQLRPDFYMIAGAGGNIAVQIGSDGVVLVDSGSEAAADKVLAAIKKVTDLPTRYVINTSADADHVGGNGKLAKAGQTIFTNALGNANFGNSMTNGGAASILAHNSILTRMSAPTGKASAFPVDSWPTEAFFQKRKYLRMNGEGIEILYQPAAHTDADSFVFFRRSDVVVAGDVLDTTKFPVIDTAKGGTIQGEIEALNHLIALAIPAIPFVYQGGETYVIPGHGRLCEQLDVVNYRDMVVSVRDVVADMIKRDMTLDQIKKASPAKPYETQYGRESGSTNGFVEAIYKSLTGKN
jgi:glyoxylase-like metal-dependent hydrolase (beta-lactamase superfamily II)